MSERPAPSGPPDDVDGIRHAVGAVEGRPLEDRAAGFAELHEELLRMLESEDASPDE